MGMCAAGPGAVCGSCLLLDKPSWMVTDAARADKWVYLPKGNRNVPYF